MNCNIKCPKCGHKYMYDFKIDNLDKDSKFITFLVCKNPLCNYDIEISGKISSSNNLDEFEILNIK